MTSLEVFIEKSWKEYGIAWVIVLRKKNPRSIEAGVLVVDAWCLGVKDAFVSDNVAESELRTMVERQIPESIRQNLDTACAKKLIEGAVAYARGLGFSPHRDLKKVIRLLSGIGSADCEEVFEYGRNG